MHGWFRSRAGCRQAAHYRQGQGNGNGVWVLWMACAGIMRMHVPAPTQCVPCTSSTARYVSDAWSCVPWATFIIDGYAMVQLAVVCGNVAVLAAYPMLSIFGTVICLRAELGGHVLGFVVAGSGLAACPCQQPRHAPRTYFMIVFLVWGRGLCTAGCQARGDVRREGKCPAHVRLLQQRSPSRNVPGVTAWQQCDVVSRVPAVQRSLVGSLIRGLPGADVTSWRPAWLAATVQPCSCVLLQWHQSWKHLQTSACESLRWLGGHEPTTRPAVMWNCTALPALPRLGWPASQHPGAGRMVRLPAALAGGMAIK